jgi:hypothetical protein
MGIRKSDIFDADIYDVQELNSDGYFIYLPSISLVSTTSSNKTVVIHPIPDGEGLLLKVGDHTVESGDKVYLFETGAADGYYLIDQILTNTSFTVRNLINDSTDGYVNFIYPSGATNIGFEPGSLTSTNATNVQDAIKDAHLQIETLITTSIDPDKHQVLRQLIHFINDGPADGFASGAYKEMTPIGSPFPTYIAWYFDFSKSQKIVDKTLILNPQKSPTTITWNVYQENGINIAHTVIDSIIYDSGGVFEVSRTRTII